MARIDFEDLNSIPELQDLEEFYLEVFGFVPNGIRLMAHRPAIVAGFMQLRRAVVDPTTSQVPVAFKDLVGHIASKVAGCRYCQAHTIFGANRAGVEAERLEALWEYQTSDLFTEAERAALDLAAAAAAVPNGVTDELFARVREYWDDGQIVEIMAVIALYGFLNRWNDTLTTPLEEPSQRAAAVALGNRGWDAGKHGHPPTSGA